MIHGVELIPLTRIPDERGTVSHMLRASDPHFVQFGEIYFSSVYPGVIKGWHRHDPATLNYACIVGTAKVVLFDGRDDSPTHGVDGGLPRPEQLQSAEGASPHLERFHGRRRVERRVRRIQSERLTTRHWFRPPFLASYMALSAMSIRSRGSLLIRDGQAMTPPTLAVIEICVPPLLTSATSMV